MTRNRRKYARVPFESLISVDRVDDSILLAHTLDLSVEGIRFQALGLALEPGELLRVQLTLEDRTITVVGRTVRVTAIDAFTQEVALRFVQVDPDTQRFLEGQEPLLTEDEIDAGLSALEPRGEREAAPREKRGAPRYEVTIPAIMEDESQFLTGLLANISTSGALLTNPTGSLPVGARGRIRLLDLDVVLRTKTESLSLEAEIVAKEPRGYRLRFLGDLDEVEQLFEREFGRSAIKLS